MKFLATSDLHGYLPEIREEFDLLMICGDICPDLFGIEYNQLNWFEEVFVKWVNYLPFKNEWSKIIVIPGNHDKCFEKFISNLKIMEWEGKTNNHLKILIHDMYEFEYPVNDGIDSLIIFGTPYCKKFGTWAFMEYDDTLEKKYSQIPDNVDILLSHDSPNINKIGAVLDENSRYYNPFAGNDILPKHIERIKPSIFHSGHMHSGNHNPFFQDGCFLENVSLVDEDINPVYNILKYSFNEETKTVEYV